MPAKLAVANDSLLLQINDRRIVALTHRRQVTPGRMAPPVIVPVRRAAKDVIQVPFADHATAAEHLVLERLHHPGDGESLGSFERGYAWAARETTTCWEAAPTIAFGSAKRLTSSLRPRF